MVFCAQRLVLLLIFIGFFSLQLEMAYGLRSSDLVLRWTQEDGFASSRRLLVEEASVENFNSKQRQAHGPSAFDPNQSSKRRVRGGSDPIHNRC
ncbi:hypothetical protein AMTRI_Chr04g190210 [Amborella trichopoda]